MPTREEYAATIEGYVRGGVNVGTSADDLYQSLRNTPYYAPRSVVREVWNEVVRADIFSPLINTLGEDELIPRSWVYRTNWKYTQPFAALVEVTGVNLVTGRSETKYVTKLYNNMPTTGQIYSDASDSIWVDETFPRFEPTTFSIQRVSHVRKASWSTP